MSHQLQRHPLPVASSGSHRELLSLHFGQRQSGKKVYMQASLHTDEIPGMLVAHHLRARLAALDAAGKIAGEIVLVPVANPIGLGQTVHGMPFGRFDLASGINFNRGFRNLIPELKTSLAGRLGADARENTLLVRRAALALLAQTETRSEADAMKILLQTLACDADIVLDLHCDNEAAMHVYTGAHLADAVAPLARLLGAEALLTAHESGDDPFDESCGRLWPELAAHFGPAHPFDGACLSVTIELRGEVQVTHALAQQDAAAILDFLACSGHIDAPVPALPPARCGATPLEGVQRIDAPAAGVVVFLKQIGDQVSSGETVAELIDPLDGTVIRLNATVSGCLFARTARRYACRGMSLAKIAGPIAFRTGKLLSQ